jgi:hypothetical protein
MAKRRKEKDDEEEKLEFNIPKFDEEKFLKKEREKIKVSFLSFIFGFIVALISFGFWALLSNNPIQWTLVFLFGFFTAAWLNYIFNRLNIDIELIGRRGMITTYFIYIFTWIFVLIILVNPPFYDNEPPKIEVITLPDIQEINGSVKIVAQITDNAGIQNNKVQFSLTHNDSIIVNSSYSLNKSIFLYEYDNTEDLIGEFTYTIIVNDNSGFEEKIIGKFEYDTDAIKVPEPLEADTSPGPTVSYTTDIKIDVKSEVDWVYYEINGEKINTTLDANKRFYITSPIVDGWEKATHTSMNVYAKTIHYFENNPMEYNNTIIDTSTYFFNVTDSSEIGTSTPPNVSLPQPRHILVPGFETVIFLISLVGLILIFKYKKRHNQDKS